jgi:hypothetical protein
MKPEWQYAWPRSRRSMAFVLPDYSACSIVHTEAEPGSGIAIGNAQHVRRAECGFATTAQGRPGSNVSHARSTSRPGEPVESINKSKALGPRREADAPQRTAPRFCDRADRCEPLPERVPGCLKAVALPEHASGHKARSLRPSPATLLPIRRGFWPLRPCWRQTRRRRGLFPQARAPRQPAGSQNAPTAGSPRERPKCSQAGPGDRNA